MCTAWTGNAVNTAVAIWLAGLMLILALRLWRGRQMLIGDTIGEKVWMGVLLLAWPLVVLMIGFVSLMNVDESKSRPE